MIDKAYSMDDLKSISYEQVSSVTTKLNAMRQSGTGKTWLFTGGTEAVADFKNSSTIVTGLGFLRIPCAAAAAILKEDVSYSIQPVAVPMLLLFLQITTNRSMLTTRRQ